MQTEIKLIDLKIMVEEYNGTIRNFDELNKLNEFNAFDDIHDTVRIVFTNDEDVTAFILRHGSEFMVFK